MKKIIVLVLVGLVVFSGCTWFKKDPQKAVSEGIVKFSEIKKLKSSLKIEGLVQAPAGEMPQRMQFTINAESRSDISDEKAPKIDTSVQIAADFDGKKGNGELLFRIIDDKIFANLVKIELPGVDAAQMQQELASVLNSWWVMPVGENNPLGKLTDEQKKLREHFKNTQFFTNAIEDGVEDVKGEKSTRYRVDLNKDALKNFIIDMARSSENQLGPEETKSIEESLKNVEFSGAVWVGDDSIVHRISGALTIRSDEGPNSSFEIDYIAWDYNQNVEVSPPEGAKEFNPLMLYPLLGAFGVFDQGTTTAAGTTTSAQ